MNFATALRNRVTDVLGAERPVSDLHVLLGRYGVNVSISTCDYWLRGERRPRDAHMHGVLDALVVAGPDRETFWELWRQVSVPVPAPNSPTPAEEAA